ncbi:arylamine N-acetyltransferase [Candidatus Berkiella aquae]|uniref:Arylamine N-acetyltransferase n=1 Tax=Candidatus Berkiella aquae TaxID=295108 RepID=A0A0Q9Z0Y8_9GAMM|nr:arylamine N-acetyltransferase [Candidatus Berkiella aquae]MCS5711912.1 arylamine N-acetyltransferase [Candidatus Berkiella aquae]
MPTITNVEKLTPLQLKAYLARIGLDPEQALQPDYATLTLLHEAHTLNVPFEDLSLHLDLTHDTSKPLDISMANVFKKIVENNRGGYCYEMNKLFAAALSTIGFTVYAHKASVLWGFEGPKRAPAHRLLTIDIKGELFLGDVGFGGPGQIAPLKMIVNQEQTQGGHTYRLVLDEDNEYELQKLTRGKFERLYAFNHQITYEESDYEVNNLYTSTNSESFFVKTLFCTKPLRNGRVMLVENTFKQIEIVNGKENVVKSSKDVDAKEYCKLLVEHFGIRLAPRRVEGLLPLYEKQCAQPIEEKIAERYQQRFIAKSALDISAKLHS